MSASFDQGLHGELGASLKETAERSRSWLLEQAAPLWAFRGRQDSGLFAERMTLSGEPDDSYFRTFVQARHIFSFVEIGRMGWDGPWRDLVGETIEALLKGARRADGFFVHKLDRHARPLDDRADLYDQAFVLFALGSAGGALGREELIEEAEQLLDLLEARWAHPHGGFTEGEIVDSRVRRQNPHMHLLEAFLALSEASGRPHFRNAAATIADLAERKFIDPPSGALLEYFEGDWASAAGIEGRIAEPGHCFEWAWLFERLGGEHGLREQRVSDRLTEWGRRFGIDPHRDVARNEVLTDGTVHDDCARLWPQTERLKAAAIRHRRLGTHQEAAEILAASDGLARYLAVDTPGLWRDKLSPNGNWIEEMVPGSSLYHVCCAFAELDYLA